MGVFLVRDGVAATTSVTSDILESITRDTVITLLDEALGVRVEEREVDRTELSAACAVFFRGTLGDHAGDPGRSPRRRRWSRRRARASPAGSVRRSGEGHGLGATSVARARARAQRNDARGGVSARRSHLRMRRRAAFLPPRNHHRSASHVRDAKSRTKCVSAMSFLLTRFRTTRIA